MKSHDALIAAASLPMLAGEKPFRVFQQRWSEAESDRRKEEAEAKRERRAKKKLVLQEKV